MRFSTIMIAFGLAVNASSTRAEDVQVPAQRELTTILTKYNGLHAEAPNNIQEAKVDAAYEKEFCANIPKGDVSGWIGEVDSIDEQSPNGGVRLSLYISTEGLVSGGLGVELSLGNFYAYGVSDENTPQHSQLLIAKNAPLYNVAATLGPGDTVAFGGRFVPFNSPTACYDAISYATYVSLFQFSSLQKLGYGLTLQ